MDPSRFDHLTRIAHVAHSRRAALAAIIGGVFLGGAGALGLTTTDAKTVCGKQGACATGQVCCNDQCVECCTNDDCPNGETCVDGSCDGGQGCTSDADCPPNGLCLIDGTCYFPSTCPAGTSNLDCCRQAVRRACRHSGGGQGGHGEGGHPCRHKGFKRCQKNFGTTA